MVRLDTPTPHTLPPALATAVFAALAPFPARPGSLLLPPPLSHTSSSLTPPSCPSCAPLLSAVHTQIHSAFFFSSPPYSRRHRRRHHHLGSGFVALARTQTSQNHPPKPKLPTHPPFVTVVAWACQRTVYVWWLAAGLSNTTQRDFSVGRAALLKLLNDGFAPHSCGRDRNSHKTLAPSQNEINQQGVCLGSLTACVPIRNVL